MNAVKKGALVFLLALIIALAFAPAARANSAEPPRLIVIADFSPGDLEVYLRLGGEDEIQLVKTATAWEARFTFYSGMLGVDASSAGDARLIARSGGESFECPLPEETLRYYNNVLTLDFQKRTLTDGRSPARSALLIFMRVALTLLIEGAIFYLFGYRKKRSYIAFLIINLLTQGGLNLALSGANSNGYLILALIVLEILILLVEMIAFLIAVNEHKRIRTALYVIAANLASLILGGLMITYLPV